VRGGATAANLRSASAIPAKRGLRFVVNSKRITALLMRRFSSAITP
jgi:hypothetical protein